MKKRVQSKDSYSSDTLETTDPAEFLRFATTVLTSSALLKEFIAVKLPLCRLEFHFFTGADFLNYYRFK